MDLPNADTTSSVTNLLMWIVTVLVGVVTTLYFQQRTEQNKYHEYVAKKLQECEDDRDKLWKEFTELKNRCSGCEKFHE